jgi:hypothetical protein
MHEAMTRRALVAEGLVTAMLDGARAVSATLQGELQRTHWEQKTGKEGLEAALSLLRGHLGPLVTGEHGARYSEVLRRARGLARAVEELEWQAGRRPPPS